MDSEAYMLGCGGCGTIVFLFQLRGFDNGMLLRQRSMMGIIVRSLESGRGNQVLIFWNGEHVQEQALKVELRSWY